MTKRVVIGTKAFSLVFTAFLMLSTTAAFAQTGTWVSRAPLPNSREIPPAGVIDGKLYVVSGCCVVRDYPYTRFTDMRIYDPSTDSWTSGSSIPLGVYAAGAGVIGSKLYVAAGQKEDGNVDTLQIYDAATQMWSQGPSMPDASAAPAAGVINGKLYVAGGMNAANIDTVNTLRIFDPQSNSWTTGPAMPTGRAGAAGAVVDGRLYVIGGGFSTGQFSNAVEAYDPVANSWSVKAAIPTARSGLSAAVVGGMVYAVGGYNGSYLNTVEAYDPVTNAWSVQDPMPNVHYGATVGVLGDELHVVSGEGEGGAFTGAHDAFVASILNTPPTADAGPDQAARPGATINLNGAASFDDNTPSSQLGYAWSFVATPSGSAASLTGANTATPSFVADVPGNYAIELIVTDEGGLNSAADQVIVGTDLPPTANAGSDQLVVLGTTVTLNGSGSDPDGDSLTFSWTFASMPAGSGASLNGAQSQTPTFVPNVPGPYVVALTVSDALGAGSPDTADHGGQSGELRTDSDSGGRRRVVAPARVQPDDRRQPAGTDELPESGGAGTSGWRFGDGEEEAGSGDFANGRLCGSR